MHKIRSLEDAKESSKPRKTSKKDAKCEENIKRSHSKAADDKKEAGTKTQKHRRLSRLHSIHRNDEDLFASAVAATARRASIAVGPEFGMKGSDKTGKQTRGVFDKDLQMFVVSSKNDR